jgi:outer membrane protein TolC
MTVQLNYQFWSAIVTLIALLGSQAAFAQALTLPQALKLAQANRLELTNQQLQTRITATDEARRRARWQPQVSASADFRWNTQIQRNIIKGAPFANGKDVLLRFGTPISNVLTVQAEQKVYDAQSRFDRSINQLNVESGQSTLEKLAVEVRQQVTEAYYEAVFTGEKRRLSAQAYQRAEDYLNQAQIRFGAGTLLKTDLDRFALELSNAEQTQRTDERDYALSLDKLRYRINSPQSVEPADSLGALLTAVSLDDETTGERVELRQEAISRQLNELGGRREQARLAPVVTAYGAYVAQQLADTFNPLASGTWFPYNYVGLRVSVPLFDGRQTRLNRQDYARRTQINQNTLQQLRNELDYERRSARNTLQEARENLTQTRRNTEQARQILVVDRVRFEAGTLLMADFRASEFSLRQAENNYLRAVYEVLRGQVALQKAVGNL